MSRNGSGKIANGFTLLEVMIVVAILGILVAIALPSYERYVLRGHRVEARNMLQDVAQKIQQNYSVNRVYNEDSSGNVINDARLASWGLNASPAGASGGAIRYNISFSAAPDASSYTLQAVPQGAQAKDECGTFAIDQRGVKTANGKGARDELSLKCWRS